jgi:hypothetical protein
MRDIGENIPRLRSQCGPTRLEVHSSQHHTPRPFFEQDGTAVHIDGLAFWSAGAAVPCIRDSIGISIALIGAAA